MVDYNNYAKTFANSRKNMKWGEIDYFLNNLDFFSWIKILDIWAGSGRLYGELCNKFWENNFEYTWLELSSELIKEAKKQYENIVMKKMNMLDLDKLKEKYDAVFFIASFHHLEASEERNIVLNKLAKLLNKNAKIYLTNWALNSEVNKEKFEKSRLTNTENEFWGEDYSIKIWANYRFYHAFTLEELTFLFEKNDYNILENRLFDNQRNYISIINKK